MTPPDLGHPYRLGLLGGTFDPPHVGHLALAELCIAQLDLDELVWIPTGMSWQKAADITPAPLRLAMTELAARAVRPGRARVRVSTMEVERSGPSYTSDTVRELRGAYGPDTSMAWLMGADQLVGLDTWHGWQDLFEYVHLCVATRPGFDLHALHAPVQLELDMRRAGTALIQCAPAGRMWIDQTLAVDLSSTRLRQQLAAGERCDADLPAGVADLIQSHALYRRADGTVSA
ncbi:nicotinate-nucleotide adenylyltransferase [Ralstonia pseudosolanacearum]|uniref:nicotinate-nucleotide adenylyltransferase n=1 Tax=Ralstonia pseudosolanacearum TaxID=1310165 RepID=UPI0026762D63|nr:nicotinate-nucleotide adenylyltransferase [Ralstonia pseudosolanacearum]MDO3525295.1 nicotinate-nucleotide adenylyltransferase [Ralstonia pseudosolanacearum]MDO3530507.1 nicotinate-nucleotide adenylyltransferase [Ralstonia pseudosolanacearum]